MSSAGVEVAPTASRYRGHGVAAGHLTDQQEVPFAEIGRELLDRTAEVAGLLERYVLDGVDPEPVAIGQGNPVLVA